MLYRFQRAIALVTLSLGGAAAASSQAVVVEQEPSSYLLDLSREWGQSASLGDLRSISMASDDLELRFWEGYGLVGTWGLVLRRTAGQWQVWHTQIETCMLFLPIAVRDTLSASARARYEQQARRECADPVSDTLDGAMVISADTVYLTPAELPEMIDAVWSELLAAGLMRLPPAIPRRWIMLDGHSYVVEVRQRGVYRASVIEHVQTPEADGDRIVQLLAEKLNRYFPTPKHSYRSAPNAP